MPVLDANVSRYSFECANLASDAFQVVSFQGVEELSRLFRFDLHLVSTDPDIAFADVINQPATFTMMRGTEPVPVSGLVVHLEQAGRSPDYFAYRAVLVPRFWMLSLTHGSRVFKDLGPDEIVKQVLEDAGFTGGVDFEFALNDRYPPRSFCVQHQETDLNFVSRLLEHEGICYFFEQDGQKDKIVFTDAPDRFAPLPDEHVLVYDEHTGLAHEQETVYDLLYREQVVTGNVLMADYNPAEPTTVQQGDSTGNGMPGRYYEYGAHFDTGTVGKALADVRRQEFEARRRTLQGRSNCPALQSGFKFTLEHYYRTALNQDYLVTRVEHGGSQRKAMGVAGVDERNTDADLHYENRFTCIPADTRFRPARLTPVPRVPGLITARVESAGQGDKYAYVDDEGRYHARLHFDLDNPYGKGNATAPIRLAQPYSGAGYGFHFPNHENTEVVLACINGDIDRPLALGTVPNPNNASPVVASNKMQNVIRTKAGNEIILDDTEKETQILLKSTDAHRFLLDDKEDNIIIETTKKHKLTFDDKNENIEVKTKDGHFVKLDDKNKKITVQSKDGHRISINDQDKLITMVDESGDNIFQIDVGNKKLTIKTAKGGIEMLAPEGLIEIKAKELKVETTGDTAFKAANIKSEADSDHKMKATNISAEAASDYKQKGMNVSSEASVNHNIKGLQVKSEGSAQNDVQGALVNVKASGINTIQGSLVKIN